MAEKKTALFAILLTLALVPSALASSDKGAQIQEEIRVFKTYPFSDPDPFPLIGRLYPYFRFSGYSFKGTDQKWKMIRLENPYIRLFVTPEIGGKVWGAQEKSTGRPFIYFNKVVKFRNIAMRGPWTSGGIEFNFGAIGHTPACATPVNYLIRKEEDGSVSCWIGGLDLPSRTEWRVKIHLPKNKAYFETECFWVNPTPLHQSLYHWMNAAADAGSDLRFHYPGNHSIGHGGELHSWPVNEEGRDISFYANNDFGPSKSYHILGQFAEFFGGYWEKADFGYGHWARYDDKPGKKLWIWSLSRSGEIWKDLLTDPGNKQYIEMQTGLLFNQAASSSSITPFKHLDFAPLSTLRWKEIWFPVKDTGGMVQASPYGSLNVTRKKDKLSVKFCPLRRVDGPLEVTLSGTVLFSKTLHLAPMETYSMDLDLAGRDGEIAVDLGRGKLTWSSAGNKKELERPLKANKDFSWDSAQGLFTAADELAKQRYYDRALKGLQTCLQKEPAFLPALVSTAELYFRRAEYETALDYAKRALAVNTYHAGANFIYGLIQEKRKRLFDARDGYGLAARSTAFRSAAYSRLAALELRDNHREKAVHYAIRSLDFDRRNIESLRVQAIAARIGKNRTKAEKILHRIQTIDPLNHFASFETYLWSGDDKDLNRFKSLIRSELPHETYLELALDYIRFGQTDAAARVIKAAPSQPVVGLWKAYLLQGKSEQASRTTLDNALSASPYLVFPFRQETIPVLEWVIKKTGHWKARYYLGLLLWNLGRKSEALDLFQACGNTPGYSPFYLARAALLQSMGGSDTGLSDIKKAIQADPQNWRAWHAQTQYFLDAGSPGDAIRSAETIYRRRPGDYILAMDYAKTLLRNNLYKKSFDLLARTRILPYEGAREGHDLYRQAGLLYALSRLKKGDPRDAIKYIDRARQWPENLGVGRPYDVDERIEDFAEALCFEKAGEKAKAGRLYDAVLKATQKYRSRWGAGHYISALVYRANGRTAEAEALLSDWKKAVPDGDAVVQWALASFHNQQKEAASALLRMSRESRGTPWNPGSRDSDFLIVLRISSMMKK